MLVDVRASRRGRARGAEEGIVVQSRDRGTVYAGGTMS